MTDERIDGARLQYERAVFAGDDSGLQSAERDLDALEADLALARGRLLHARYLQHRAEDPHELELFERSARLYQAAGDCRGEGEAMFWVGTFHQVVRDDNATALPALERSRDLARKSGDTLTLSYALRHLGIHDHAVGRLDSARDLLEESVQLRQEIGFLPGVAANLVGLAYIAVAQNRLAEASALLAEAATLAEASGAHSIVQQVEQARAQL